MQLRLAERNAKIYEARLAGRTLRSIADEYGIGRQTVHVICTRAERLAERRRQAGQEAAGWFDLSTRTRNCIWHLYFPHTSGLTAFTAKTVAAVVGPDHELLRVPNFGRKSLRELREWLAKHGEHTAEPAPAAAKTPWATCPHCGQPLKSSDVIKPPLWRDLAPGKSEHNAAEFISATYSAEELLLRPDFDDGALTRLARWLYRHGYRLRMKPGPVTSPEDVVPAF